MLKAKGKSSVLKIDVIFKGRKVCLLRHVPLFHLFGVGGLGHYLGPGEVAQGLGAVILLRQQIPGNNLYVTGLSTRVTSSDLEKVTECHLVTDPRTRESRGFAFVTMETVEDADRCIKYLNRTVLEGRLVTVEKVLVSDKGSYCAARQKGLVAEHQLLAGPGRRRSRSYSPHRYDRDPHPRERRGRSRSPYGRGRSPSPHGRGRSRSPYERRRDYYSDTYKRRRERSLSASGSGLP
ncbi:hypothetical protein Patl1_17691 [Pistacia atlantica]|uniref:Uncharacterized protein n=1 Tax=Pistacia atlantica TaxID=434234 RepID=A0ACC1C3A0_9ROSI|nr:hypothetical protein Patl1_17691 [Pistacia atlantica]